MPTGSAPDSATPLTMPLVHDSVDMIKPQPLASARLELELLRPEHADEMAPLLDDPALHTFIGGKPATAEELRDRYERHAVGRSPDRSEVWLNWILRRRDSGQVVGTVQATASDQQGRLGAEVAWVIGVAHQQHGYAKEAAQLMVGWLQQQGVEVVIAHVHPRHEASMAVARAVGLAPTNVVVEGEVRWQG